MDPTTHGLMAIAVFALLCCMRRRRTGEPPAVDAEEARAADEAFQQFNNFNEAP